MDQSKKYLKPDIQVSYKGRWVPRSNFRVYVYNSDNEKIAEGWDEYNRLIASGLWFDERPKEIILPELKPEPEPEPEQAKEESMPELIKVEEKKVIPERRRRPSRRA